MLEVVLAMALFALLVLGNMHILLQLDAHLQVALDALLTPAITHE